MPAQAPPAPAAAAPLPSRAALAALLDSARREAGLPALAAAVVTSEGMVAAAVGSRRLGGAADVTDADRFHLGSNGKAMTALLVGRLAEEGRLALDAPLARLFPDVAPRMHPAWRAVTLRHLLTHTSGLPANPPRRAWAGAPAGDARAQRAAVVAWALTRAPAGTPGRFAYSNLGYIVAGAAAERAAGQAFEPLLVARLLAPIGVTTAGFGAAGTPGRGDQPLGHRGALFGRRAPVEPGPAADNPPPYSPAGRVHMSVGDYARFVRAVLAGARGRDGVVRAATVRALLADQVPARDGGRYAAGAWGVVPRPWAAGDAYTHAGSNTMNFAVTWMAPARDVAVLVLTNDGSRVAPAAADRVATRLLQPYLRTGPAATGARAGAGVPNG